ncbi:serine/threonine protein kinase [Roseiconus nitratireducens]|uniref:Serine/threonine protein kinase n=1 Tax=Roseiconus nitratireducens TaxID=2605748 RepID=A0A5M6CZL6_9BACT|nr:serine/threonine-protein kinase [Roseiconus nitratireducens]KAA5539472.1 serine/threonine protein kinase [Roseiconus nitratireducens]
MLTKSTCPPRESLQQYVLGQYCDEEGDRLEQHLAECATCEQSLASLEDASDSLIRHLPLAAVSVSDSEPDPPWLQQLMPGPNALRPQSPASIASADTPGNQALGSYRLTGILGQGGMGVIYSAFHEQLGREVAIKVVNPRLCSGGEAQARFDREIALLGKLNHPGIVTAIDAGRLSGAAYLVMEKVDGVDLSRLLRHSGPLTIPEACEIARQMASALAAAHEAGAVHRDIKPSNVMINRQGQVILLDFGLATAIPLLPSDAGPQTSFGQLLGTLDYMSPEQAVGNTAGPPADLFGLGATLFFMLTGRPPRPIDREAGLLEQLRHIGNDPAPPLNSLRPGAPDELHRLVATLLQVDPLMRPKSASSVAETLKLFCGNEPNKQLRLLVDEAPNRASVEGTQSVKESLSALLGPQETDTSLGPSDTETKLVSLRRGNWKSWIGGGAMLAAICLGIVLLLNTRKGTVRIESDLSHAEVQFVDESEEVTGVQIERGDRELKLRVGLYKVTLKDESGKTTSQPIRIAIESGETTVVRAIRQTDSGDPALNVTRLGNHSLFQGAPRSVWEKRFHAETDAAAKVEAAAALIHLPQSTNEAQQVAAVIQLGGQLAESGWGRDATAYLDDMVRQHEIRPRNWVRAKRLDDAWNAFVSSAATKLSSIGSPDGLIQQLCQIITVAPKHEAAFAASMLDRLDHRVDNEQQVANEIISTNLEDPDFGFAFSFIQIKHYQDASDSAKARFAKKCDAIVNWIIEQDQGHPPYERVEDWLTLANRRDIPIDGSLEARLAQSMLFADPFQALNGVFQRRWINDGEYPYSARSMKVARDANPVLWNHWMPVACDWLVDHPEPSPRSNHVLATLDVQLRLRKASDAWPIDRLVQTLGKRVLRPLDGEAFESEHHLLALIVMAGGDLPAAVRDQIHSGIGTFPDEVRELEAISRQDVDWNIMRENFRRSEGLLSKYPAQTVTVLLRDTVPDDGEPWQPNRFRERLAWLSTRGDGNDSPPPMEPLLLLAIATELSGEDSQLDDRLSTLFTEQHPARTFRRHLEDAVTSPFAVSDVATRLLQLMRTRSKSDRLVEEINRLIPDHRSDSVAALSDDSGRSVAPLYQGQSRTHWRRRFDAETDPVAKIEAAKALITLTEGEPDRSRLTEMLNVAGTLYQAGWGRRLEDLFSKYGWSGTGYRFDPAQWSRGSFPDLESTWRSFREATEVLCESAAPEIIAAVLCDTIESSHQDDVARAAYAILLLEDYSIVSEIRSDQTAVDRIIGLKLPEDAALVPYLTLAQSRYYSSASDGSQKSFRDRYLRLGEMFATGPIDDFHQFEMAEDWLKRTLPQWFDPNDDGDAVVRQPDLPLEGQLVARVALQMMIGDPANARRRIFYTDPIDEAAYEYASNVESSRVRAGPIWDHWIPPAMEWLQQNVNAKSSSSVLGTFNKQLRIRKPEDNWPVTELGSFLSSQLLAPIKSESEDATSAKVSTLNWLTLTVLTGQPIPEKLFAQTESDARLSRYRALFREVDEYSQWKEFYVVSDGLVGLLSDHPIQVIREAFSADSLPENMSAMTAVTFVSDSGRHRAEEPKMDPVLALAILSELIGENDQIDERLAECFDDEDAFFRRHLRPLWRSGTAAEAIALKYLRRIRNQTKNAKLIELIEEVSPLQESDPE